MAVLRLTAATAYSSARQLVAELARWSREAGPLSAAPALQEGLDGLAGAPSDASLSIEVMVDRSVGVGPLEQVIGRLASGLSADGVLAAINVQHPLVVVGSGNRETKVFVTDVAARRIYQSGGLRPSVLVVCCGSAAPEASFVRSVQVASEDRPAAFWLGPAQSHDAATLLPGAWYAEHVLESDASTVHDRLTRPPFEDLWGMLEAESLVRGVESLGAAFKLAIEQEMRGIRARRTMAQQGGGKAPPRDGAPSANELSSAVKAALQKHFSEFIRGIDERSEADLTPMTGALWQTLEGDLAAIDALDEERRTKTTALRIPAATQDAWLTAVERGITSHCAADLVAMRDLFRLAASEVEQVLSAAGGPPAVPQFQFLDDGRQRRLLKGLLTVQRPYASEVPRPGLLEYAMVARRYQMVALMFVSAFGMSFLRKYREFMLPSAVLLLTLGGMNVMNTVKRERVETRTKELERARDTLRAEARRILSEVQRSWVTTVGQHLTDQVASVVTQLDSVIRDHQTRQTAALTQERQRSQRQLQGLETAERRLQGPWKGSETVAGALSQLHGELRQLLMTPLRNARKPSS